MKNIFQCNVEKIFYTLKHGKKTPVPSRMEAVLPNARKLEIYAITNNLLDENLIIKLLAGWRDKANIWFPAQFRVTFKGTKKWTKEQLIDKKDRILFLFKVKGEKEPFAHAGLYRFDYKNQSCEIDNVIRGKESENTKGAMTVGLESLINWSFRHLGIKDIYLKVFSDNKKAIVLYERLGFKEMARTPLISIRENGIIKWVEVKEDANTRRYFVKMHLRKLE